MMMNRLAKAALAAAKAIQSEVPKRGAPPEEGLEPASEQVLASSLVRRTRGYIEKTVNQINGCYESGYFDACAVMIRRLVETLIIEAYEHKGIAERIKNSNDEFFPLSDLIDKILSEKMWNLSRNTKSALRDLKRIGDLSAHNRRYTAHRSDIDKVLNDLRVATQELITIAGLK